jgi:hypothetical protein
MLTHPDTYLRNYAATTIQKYWRGYRVRKRTIEEVIKRVIHR